MTIYNAFAPSSLLLLLAAASTGDAFVPSSPSSSFGFRRRILSIHQPAPPLASSPSVSIDDKTTSVYAVVDERTGKPTGTSFLPDATIARAMVGSPIEKIKMAKDGTSAFVDVYEYARKIREGEMTWEEVEKADLDTVCYEW
jgi:hypothetical protein